MTAKYPRQTKWAKRHPEQRRKIQQRYRLKHLVKIQEYGRQHERGLKQTAMENYNPNGKAECASCGETRLVTLTLSHLAPIPALPRSASKLYRALRRLGYPELPLLTECMNCNVFRDNWGRGYHVK